MKLEQEVYGLHDGEGAENFDAEKEHGKDKDTKGSEEWGDSS